jgi:hypothetical protein
LNSPLQKQAKEFAKKRGYKTRQVANSLSNPNGYIKIVAPDGRELKASNWAQATEIMRTDWYK